MYRYHVLQAEDRQNVRLLSSMHSLRYDVFYVEKGWRKGLYVRNCMEFDDYDRKGTFYIARTNPDGDVDMSCRLQPTSLPYMIEEHYPQFVENQSLPVSDQVWEFSRACASKEAREQSKNILGLMITAAVEFGLVNGVKNYISLTTDSLIPVITRLVGWDGILLGAKHATPDDDSFGALWPVDYDAISKLRTKNKIPGPLIYDFDSNIQNVRELWHDNYLSQKNGTTYLPIARATNGIGRDLHIATVH